MNDQQTKSKIKIGRKGDPRMRRAVIAKMNDSSLTLHDALIAGGFDYPKIDEFDGSSKYALVDSDGVLLGQRKNQLSRRLREAKRQMDSSGNQNDAQPSDNRGEDVSYSQSTVGDDCSSSAKKKSEKSSREAINDNELSTPSVSVATIPSPSLTNHPPAPPKKPTGSNDRFLENLTISDSFHIPKIPIPTKSDFILNQYYQLNQDREKTKSGSQTTNEETSSLGSRSFEFSTGTKKLTKTYSTYHITNEYIKTDFTFDTGKNYNKPNNSTIDAPSKINPFNVHKMKTYTGLDKNESINFGSRPRQNSSKLKEAIDIFNSENSTHLQGIMRRAGYSPSQITENSSEYLTFLAEVINSEIERFENLKINSAFSLSSNTSIPLKKRIHKSSSENTFQKVHMKKYQDGK